jgi:hypothetical protein
MSNEFELRRMLAKHGRDFGCMQADPRGKRDQFVWKEESKQLVTLWR